MELDDEFLKLSLWMLTLYSLEVYFLPALFGTPMSRMSSVRRKTVRGNIAGKLQFGRDAFLYRRRMLRVCFLMLWYSAK